MQGKLRRVLPLLRKLVEERAGEKRFSPFHPALHEPVVQKDGAHDKNLHVVGRAALLRRPRIQGRAAALPCQKGEDLCPAPRRTLFPKKSLTKIRTYGLIANVRHKGTVRVAFERRRLARARRPRTIPRAEVRKFMNWRQISDGRMKRPKIRDILRYFEIF